MKIYNKEISQNKLTLAGSIVAVIIIVVLSLIILFRKPAQTLESATPTDQPSISTSTALVEKISLLIELPKDEEPTIATVVDPKLLQDQPFFIRAQVGDKVLIYEKAKKVILYDPIANRIREEAVMSLNNQRI